MQFSDPSSIHTEIEGLVKLEEKLSLGIISPELKRKSMVFLSFQIALENPNPHN